MAQLDSNLPRQRWLARLRAAAVEAARELEIEHLVWARTWGRTKAQEAVEQLGCDLGRGGVW